MNIAYGGLLHDIGKILYRSSEEKKTHPKLGEEFLIEAGVSNQAILDQVRWHHYKGLEKQEGLAKQSAAYITYIADNIASGADRRDKEEAGHKNDFSRRAEMESIFNHLNGNNLCAKYSAETMKKGIVFPTNTPEPYSKSYYDGIKNELKKFLSGMEYSIPYLNSLLEILEAETSFVPSSTDRSQYVDVSLFDHLKLTSAIGCCIFQYAEEQGISDYEKAFFKDAMTFYGEKAFMIVKIALTGREVFLSNHYGNEDVLDNVRARSFYFDLLFENAVDNLLEEEHLSRVNLIYSGGGNALLLLPNTDSCKAKLISFEKRMQDWLLEHFGALLSFSIGTAACTSNDMSGNGKPFGAVLDEASCNLKENQKKCVTAHQLRLLNKKEQGDGIRECRICHSSKHLRSNGLCDFCSGMLNLAGAIRRKDYFTTIKGESGIPIGPDHVLRLDTEKQLLERIRKCDENYIRSYSKNKAAAGHSLASKIWTGDYSAGDSLEALAKSAEGFSCLSAVKINADDLERSIAEGLPENMQTLSRISSLSRKLSQFFQNGANEILKSPKTFIGSEGERKVSLISTGSGDIFAVGAWDSIIGFTADFEETLNRFTSGSVTVSSAVNMFKPYTPVPYVIRKTEEMEEYIKAGGKNAVSLLEKGKIFSWESFEKEILGEKLKIIQGFLDRTDDYGTSFLYHLLSLLTHREKKINIPRFAYVLSRMEPPGSAPDYDKMQYKEFSANMFDWASDDSDAAEAAVAIILYIYLHRNSKV